VTGLGLTWDYEFMQDAHAFMGMTHAITVILLLVWLPFGKFFHVFQRPAQLGIARPTRGRCRPQPSVRTGEPFTSAMHVADVTQVATEIGLDFSWRLGVAPRPEPAGRVRPWPKPTWPPECAAACSASPIPSCHDCPLRLNSSLPSSARTSTTRRAKVPG
jgi:hypothetical protein